MYRIVKSIIDKLSAALLLVLLVPILFMLCVLLLLSSNNSNIFFTQDRPGKDGKIFKLVKFKTMTDERDSNGNLLSDEQRLTKIGRFIRSTSLDELPQLWNILKGDMSFIGPRPLLKEYLPLYNSHQSRRHNVKPGMTGWAQINGRNQISWQQKFDYDVWYVDNISFLLDLKIVFLTIKKVIVRENINASDAATMQPFKGNNN